MEHDNDRYSRQVLFPGIGREGQQRLADARVVLVGCGANGSAIADRLVRAGVGHLVIIDRDYVETNNLQRQVLYDEEDVAARLPKAVAAQRHLRRINSQASVRGVVADLNAENGEELLLGANLVMDGSDNFEVRYLVNDVCVKHGIPWVYCGVVASYGMTMTIVPHQTPCLRCVFDHSPLPGSTATCDTAGIVNPIVFALTGVAAADGIKLLVGRGELHRGIVYIDLWHNVYDVLDTGGPRADCPACGQGDYTHLHAPAIEMGTSLCGRNAVQIRPHGVRMPSLDSVVERLRGVAQIVASNDHLVCLRVEGCEITLFDDGRAIVKGTDDLVAARSLYARYIGY
jgi:molybdopterin/thiamine biosynthesis adenylyltransferase